MWPINRVSDPTKFYGIAMNVIDVPRKIYLLPDWIFPIPPLPEAPLTLGLAAGINMHVFATQINRNVIQSDSQ